MPKVRSPRQIMSKGPDRTQRPVFCILLTKALSQSRNSISEKIEAPSEANWFLARKAGSVLRMTFDHPLE